MQTEHLKFSVILKSKLAQRLIPIFVAVVAIPLAATVFVVGAAARQQIITMANSMEGINNGSIKQAGLEFQALGSITMHRTARETALISQRTVQGVSKQWERNQTQSLASTRDAVARLTNSSVGDAMQKSLKSNNAVLSSVSLQMDKLFSNSAHYTQASLVDRVQAALIEQIKIQLQDRAAQLADSADSYIVTQQNYLTLTAQMVNLYHGDPTGQKAVLNALLRRFPMFMVVSVLDTTGQETAMSASDTIVTESDLSNRVKTEYFRRAMSDQPYVSVDQIPTDGHAPILRIAVPIEQYRGKVIGILAARLSLDDLWDKIRTTHIGQNGQAFVDYGGSVPGRSPGAGVIAQNAPIESLGWRVVVAQPRDEVMAPVKNFRSDIEANTKRSLAQVHGDIKASAVLATTRLRSDALHLGQVAANDVKTRTQLMFQQVQRKSIVQTETAIAGMQSAIRSQDEIARRDAGNQMMTAARSATREGAMMSAPLITRALDSASHHLALFGLLIILISGLGGCVIGLFAAGALVRPILRLANGTRAIAAGKLDNRVDERAPAELGDLAIAFNKMAESLQKSGEDLRNTESQLVQSAKLASLGTLSAGVAHELNQPVAIVRGIAQQLQGEPSLSTDIVEDLALIEGQTGRMMKIIKHLRTFCRSGGVDKVTVDVNQVLSDCFILISAQLTENAIKVNLSLSEAQPTVMGDANELEQVFINLITNARDALDKQVGAELTISTSNVLGKVAIEFRDNGTGIPDEIAAHIFDPFFTTKEAGKGTGLGLSISHGIIQKHSGTINVRNDHGAVFTIRLPQCSPDRANDRSILRAA